MPASIPARCCCRRRLQSRRKTPHRCCTTGSPSWAGGSSCRRWNAVDARATERRAGDVRDRSGQTRGADRLEQRGFGNRPQDPGVQSGARRMDNMPRRTLKVWRASPAAAAAGKPGSVIDTERGSVTVAAGGATSLRLLEVQRAGGRRLPAGSSLRNDARSRRAIGRVKAAGARVLNPRSNVTATSARASRPCSRHDESLRRLPAAVSR